MFLLQIFYLSYHFQKILNKKALKYKHVMLFMSKFKNIYLLREHFEVILHSTLK